MNIRHILIAAGSAMALAMPATAAAAAAASPAPAPAAATPLTEQEAREIAVDAYLYAFPLVTMEIMRRQVTNVPDAGINSGRAPMNTLAHKRTYPDGSYRDVVRPNFDTLYSLAWLDLSREPMVFSVPDNHGRYYLVPLMDMWSEVFASPGSRTNGNGPRTFAVVAPGWRGKLPANMERIESPTTIAWMVGRTQTDGAADYAAVHVFQDGMRLTPLSKWGKPQAPVRNKRIDASIDMKTPPKNQAVALQAPEFFRLAAELMVRHRPHFNDHAMLARLQRIGFMPGKPFDLKAQPEQVQRAFEQAVPQAQKLMLAQPQRLAPAIHGWIMPTENLGNFGNSYLTRATIALLGLGANPPEDAVYAFGFVDGAGKPLNGNARYTLTFGKDDTPPARAFWSVTLYENNSFPFENPHKRYALGDRDKLKKNADGTTTLYVQAASPGPELESNWLPAPAGPFNLIMRAYYPSQAMLTGQWKMPPVRKVD